ncbi:MAG: hypothetical protein K6G90_03495, partial [Clostridia bacterium]|nr:hypothetical protein [Clostridia bacterium]
SSFSEADFFQDNEAAADNTVVLSRQMRQYWGKDALKNRFVFNSPYPMLSYGKTLRLSAFGNCNGKNIGHKRAFPHRIYGG